MAIIETIATQPRMVSISEYMRYTGLGRNKAMTFGKEIGAVVRVGSRVLYDLRKTDRYFDELSNGQSGSGSETD